MNTEVMVIYLNRYAVIAFIGSSISFPKVVCPFCRLQKISSKSSRIKDLTCWPGHWLNILI
jgi:hypothetical protein